MAFALLSLGRVSFGLAYLVAAVIMLVSPAQSSGRAWALGAVEPGTPPCTGMLPFADRPADSTLTVQSAAPRVVSVADPRHAGQSVDQIQITWAAGLADKGVQCIWLTSKPAGSPEYFMGGGNLLPADATEYSAIPIGMPGEYCYRIVAIGLKTESPATDVCVDVQHPQQISTDDNPGASGSPTVTPSAGSGQPTASPKAPDTGSGAGSGDSVAALLLVGFGTAVSAFALGGLALMVRRRQVRLP